MDTPLHTLISSGKASATLLVVSAADIQKLIDSVRADTRRIVEEQYQPHYFNTDDLMKLFKVGRTTIFNWEKSGKLPPSFKPDGTDMKLWDQAEVREWVEAGRTGRYVHKLITSNIR